MNKKIVENLSKLNLTAEEAEVYVELLKAPSTHLRLSRATGINRTKVYRIIQQLEKRSLVARHTDDQGMFLVASDPSSLEVELISEEERIKQQRTALDSVLPELMAFQTQHKDEAFIVRTYEGDAGLRQMCWHELKTKGELVSLGNGTIEELSTDPRWARKHRDRQIAAGYISREIINYSYSPEVLPPLASEELLKSDRYDYRMISPDIIEFDSQTIIYNDTVAVYHWKHNQRVGLEIINKTYANMFRQIFWYYWAIASPGIDRSLSETKQHSSK